LDYPTADKAVGRDAEKMWQGYHEREKVKRDVRKKTGQHALVRKNLDQGAIEYRGMVKQENEARAKFFDSTIGTEKVDRDEATREARKKDF
jgi:hypothetical protein